MSMLKDFFTHQLLMLGGQILREPISGPCKCCVYLARDCSTGTIAPYGFTRDDATLLGGQAFKLNNTCYFVDGVTFGAADIILTYADVSGALYPSCADCCPPTCVCPGTTLVKGRTFTLAAKTTGGHTYGPYTVVVPDLVIPMTAGDSDAGVNCRCGFGSPLNSFTWTDPVTNVTVSIVSGFIITTGFPNLDEQIYYAFTVPRIGGGTAIGLGVEGSWFAQYFITAGGYTATCTNSYYYGDIPLQGVFDVTAPPFANVTA